MAAPRAFTRTMASCLALLLLLTNAAAYSTVLGSNASLPAAMTAPDIIISINAGSMQVSNGQGYYSIAPLTSFAGAGQKPNSLVTLKIEGTLQSATSSTISNISKSTIAYVSCDSDGSNINASTLVDNVAAVIPKAILLYSIYSETCNFTSSEGSTPPFGSIYTMMSRADAKQLSRTIVSARETTNTIASEISSDATTNPNGPAPTTAVAMSILYSITGIITLLFLIIIATGAIRAHRHPERYGPRTGNSGRARQSRAKGLAKAMLETLPIVKFGDPEPVKDVNRDIELEDGAQNAPIHPTHPTPAANPTMTGVVHTPETGGDAQTKNTETVVGKSDEDDLGCSICTEDFTAGEDVRVLPCNHKYHPACIDPWLLNVSGTCPLCRRDLRPEGSRGENDVAEDGELPPPLVEEADITEQPHRRGLARLLDRNRLHHAPAQERIAVLRDLRQQSRDGDTAESVTEGRGRSARLRDAFRIRTRRQQNE